MDVSVPPNTGTTAIQYKLMLTVFGAPGTKAAQAKGISVTEAASRCPLPTLKKALLGIDKDASSIQVYVCAYPWAAVSFVVNDDESVAAFLYNGTKWKVQDAAKVCQEAVPQSIYEAICNSGWNQSVNGGVSGPARTEGLGGVGQFGIQGPLVWAPTTTITPELTAPK